MLAPRRHPTRCFPSPPPHAPPAQCDALAGGQGAHIRIEGHVQVAKVGLEHQALLAEARGPCLRPSGQAGERQRRCQRRAAGRCHGPQRGSGCALEAPAQVQCSARHSVRAQWVGGAWGLARAGCSRGGDAAQRRQGGLRLFVCVFRAWAGTEAHCRALRGAWGAGGLPSARSSPITWPRPARAQPGSPQCQRTRSRGAGSVVPASIRAGKSRAWPRRAQPPTTAGQRKRRGRIHRRRSSRSSRMGRSSGNTSRSSSRSSSNSLRPSTPTRLLRACAATSTPETTAACCCSRPTTNGCGCWAARWVGGRGV